MASREKERKLSMSLASLVAENAAESRRRSSGPQYRGGDGAVARGDLGRFEAGRGGPGKRQRGGYGRFDGVAGGRGKRARGGGGGGVAAAEREAGPRTGVFARLETRPDGEEGRGGERRARDGPTATHRQPPMGAGPFGGFPQGAYAHHPAAFFGFPGRGRGRGDRGAGRGRGDGGAGRGAASVQRPVQEHIPATCTLDEDSGAAVALYEDVVVVSVLPTGEVTLKDLSESVGEDNPDAARPETLREFVAAALAPMGLALKVLNPKRPADWTVSDGKSYLRRFQSPCVVPPSASECDRHRCALHGTGPPPAGEPAGAAAARRAAAKGRLPASA